jgi:adenylylsulfate kinase-like enzyme|tara:strand:+ start:696 stop:1157 length:462 start_codon:yes stop_codon:yes gene_type:complete
MIISIFGQPGSGKTTLSNLWKEMREDYFQIDGDELRDITPGTGYDENGRIQNITNANAIATYLNHQDKNVIMSLVNPFRCLRVGLKNHNPDKVFSVYLTSDRDTKREFHYDKFETPKMHEHAFHTDTTYSTPKETFHEVFESFLLCRIAKLQS